MKTKDELPECPVATTVSMIGSKWKLLIMRNLLVRFWTQCGSGGQHIKIHFLN